MFLTVLHNWNDDRIFERQAMTASERGEVTLIGCAPFKRKVIGNISIVGLTQRSRIARPFLIWPPVFIRACFSRASIVHFHDPELIPMMLLLKLLTQKMIIYDIHESYPLTVLRREYLPRRVRGLVAYLVRKLETVMCFFADQVVVAGEGIREQAHLARFRSKTTVIRNFPTAIAFDLDLTAKNETITLVASGMLAPDRGIEESVRAFSLLQRKDIKLELIGFFNSLDFENRIKDLAKNMDGVDLIGKLPYELLMKRLSRAHIGLLCFQPTPNILKATGGNTNRLYEYMAAGLAIVGPDLPGWRELFLDGKHGIIVNPTSIVEIARGLDLLISNPELVRQYSINNRKAFVEKYNWNHEKVVLLNLYEALSEKQHKRMGAGLR